MSMDHFFTNAGHLVSEADTLSKCEPAPVTQSVDIHLSSFFGTAGCESDDGLIQRQSEISAAVYKRTAQIKAVRTARVSKTK